jgi:hypothetical protein
MHPKACIIFSTERIKPDGLHKAIHVTSRRDARRAPPAFSTDIASLTGQRLFTIFLLITDNF